MAVFGHLASTESVVYLNRCMVSYSWPNTFCVVFVVYQPLPLASYNLQIVYLEIFNVQFGMVVVSGIVTISITCYQ